MYHRTYAPHADNMTWPSCHICQHRPTGAVRPLDDRCWHQPARSADVHCHTSQSAQLAITGRASVHWGLTPRATVHDQLPTAPRLLSVIPCLLDHGHGPDTRCTDTAKQRTALAYLSGRGQRELMFLPPGADNPTYTTASVRQCKWGSFSLLYREQERALRCRPIVRLCPTAGLWSPVPGVQSAIVSPVALHVCILTGVPRRRRPGRCPPFCTLILPQCRPIVQWRPTDDSPARHPGGRLATTLPRSRSPSSPLLRPFLQRFGRVTAHYVDRSDWWGARVNQQQHRGPVSDAPPPSRPCRRSNSDNASKRYVLWWNRQTSIETRECDF